MIYGVKVLGDSGSGSTAGIIQGIDQVLSKGQRPAVISMSLGGPGKDPAFHAAVAKAAKQGIPVIVAAGNSGRTNKPSACSYTPAAFKSAITVGATDRPGTSSW